MGRIQAIDIRAIKVGKRHRRNMGNLDLLAESMQAEGLLQPVGITEEKRLVFGERRLRAAKQLGWKKIDAKVVNVSSILAGEWAENEVREDFTLSERDAIRRDLEAQIPERRGRPKQEEENVANRPQLSGEKTRDITAQQVGFDSTQEARRVRKVVDAGVPELVDAMDAGEVPVSVAAKLAELPKREQKAALKDGKEGVRAATKSKPPPISEVFYQALKTLGERIDSIHDQFGSMTAMFRSKQWKHQDVGPVVILIRELHKDFVQLNREVNDYAKVKEA